MSYLYSYPKEIDKTLYSRDKDNLKTFYGLPQKVNFCKCCVISNQRPSSAIEFKNDGVSNKEVINFDENNLCDACKVKEIKQSIDWKEREWWRYNLITKRDPEVIIEKPKD